jgi:predicted RNA polymerase sigma factor
MVTLNHAIAAAMVHGPDTGLEMLKALERDEHLQGSHRLDAVRAHLLERAGEPEAALALYRSAAQKTTSIPERNYLAMRAARLSELRTATGKETEPPRDE